MWNAKEPAETLELPSVNQKCQEWIQCQDWIKGEELETANVGLFFVCLQWKNPKWKKKTTVDPEGIWGGKKGR